MAESDTKEKAAPIEITAGTPMTTVRVPNMPVMYVGNVGLAVNPMEIRLFLGDVVPNPDGSSLTATQRLCLVMPPEFAKAFAENLLQAMLDFEAKFGKLRDITGQKPTAQESRDQE